ncbi:hypothetical protein NX059_001823 [Plenodomus lindquistii]|nr:hypothetical protein NX059_001823 [Plenodomus lindquistii]
MSSPPPIPNPALSMSETNFAPEKFDTGAILHGRWVLVSKMGDVGGFCNRGIYLVRDTHSDSGKLYVLKCLPPSEESCADVAQREIHIMAQLDHACVPRLYDAHVDPGCAWVVMEYCSGGSLLGLMKQCQSRDEVVPEGFIWHVIECVARALQYCHHGPATRAHDLQAWDTIVHRDVSLANIFLGAKLHEHDSSSYPIVKLGDFGCSVTMSEVAAKGWDISKLTLVSSGLPLSGMDVSANETGDVYYFGFVLYCLYTNTVGLVPLPQSQLHLHIHDVRNAQRAVPYTTAFVNLMKQCLEADAADRPTAEALVEAALAVREMLT